MSAESNFPDLDLESAAVDHVDGVFLMALPRYARLIKKQKKPLVNTNETLPKKIETVHMIRGFSRAVYKGNNLHTVSPNATAFEAGLSFTRMAMFMHWIRKREPQKNRALNYAVKDIVNLEGDLACDPNPEFAIRAYVPERFLDAFGPYEDVLPGKEDPAVNGSRRSTFVLGAALGLAVAERVETLIVTPGSAIEARNSMLHSAEMLRRQT